MVDNQVAYNRPIFGSDSEEITRGWFENMMRDCQERNTCMPLIRLRALAVNQMYVRGVDPREKD